MRTAGGILAATVLLLVAAPLWAPLVGIGPPPAPAPGMRVDVGDGVHVNVFDTGSGPAVVLVHGLPGSGYDWTPLPARLVERGHRVVRYDRVGYGHSDRRTVDTQHHFGTNARELLALIDALELARPVLVGWSYGGGVVQVAAQQAPERVRGLVLVGSVGVLERPPPDRGLLVALLDTEMVTSWGLRSGFAARPGTARIGELAFSGQVPDWWLDHMISMLALPGAAHTFMMEREHRRPDLLAPETLRVPVLVVHGTDDRLVPHTMAEDLVRRIDGARLESVAAGSHGLPNTHADLLADQISRLAGK